jgi:sortase A
MRIRVEWRATLPARNRSVIRWSRCLFFVIGILILAYVGFVLIDARLFQAAQSRQFQQELDGLRPSIGNDERPHLLTLPPAETAVNLARADSLDIAGRDGSPLGRIEISSIGLQAMILEGTDARTLRHAVGHIPGTPLPGQQGNVAITGHRDTFFRPLHNIRKDDEITLTTLNGSYRYRVDSTQVVEPEDTEVLADSDDAVLTLVTCYPFYFVGPAPKRFIVRAYRIPPG